MTNDYPHQQPPDRRWVNEDCRPALPISMAKKTKRVKKKKNRNTNDSDAQNNNNNNNYYEVEGGTGATIPSVQEIGRSIAVGEANTGRSFQEQQVC